MASKRTATKSSSSSAPPPGLSSTRSCSARPSATAWRCWSAGDRCRGRRTSCSRASTRWPAALALVGPLVLMRGEVSEASLGELLWMTGGLLVWVFDAAAALRGDWRTTPWATPLGYQTMGMTILAVLLARLALPGRRAGLVVDERHRVGPRPLLGRRRGRFDAARTGRRPGMPLSGRRPFA